jgi:hypothetical protein
MEIWVAARVFDPWTSRHFRYGSNRIRTIENLEPLVNLEELWLGSVALAPPCLLQGNCVSCVAV